MSKSTLFQFLSLVIIINDIHHIHCIFFKCYKSYIKTFILFIKHNYISFYFQNFIFQLLFESIGINNNQLKYNNRFHIIVSDIFLILAMYPYIIVYSHLLSLNISLIYFYIHLLFNFK